MSRAKRIGSSFEVAVRDYFEANGFPGAARLAPSGRNDVGDIKLPGLPVTVECKALREIDLAQGLREAELEAKKAGNRFFVLVNKRRMRNVSDAYMTLPLWLGVEWMSFIRQALESEEQSA